MTRAQFWILNAASLLLAALIAFELYSNDRLDDSRERLREAQIPVLQAEQLQPLARRMVEQTARGAMTDPALKDLLARYGFKMTVTPAALPPPPTGPADPSTSSNP